MITATMTNNASILDSLAPKKERKLTLTIKERKLIFTIISPEGLERFTTLKEAYLHHRKLSRVYQMWQIKVYTERE